MRFRDATIKQKLTWMSVFASAIALTLATGASFGYHLITSRRALQRSLLVQAVTIGLNSVAALRFNDEGAATQTLAGLRADPNIVHAAIFSATGRPFATYVGPSGALAPLPASIRPDAPDSVRFERRTVRLYHGIVAEGERVGAVYLVYDLSELYSDAIQYVLITLLVLVLSMAAAYLAAAWIQRGLTEPLDRLVKAAKIVSRDRDYAVRVAPVRSRDELGLFIGTFNDMLAEIQTRDVEVRNAKDRLQRLSEELEERVQQRTAELEATNKELEAFTYSVSHDLRAPLRRINGFANLLVEEHAAELTAEAARFLHRVREGARQMGQLVDDLLNLARLGRKELVLHVTALSPMIESIADILQREAGDRVIEWRIEPLPPINCDPSLMEVVFVNLLSNAVKYTRPRERAVIEVGASDDDGRPVMFVRDNGVGFSMKYVDKLFGVFQRLHRPEDFEGTGVGLATVQRIIHKHGGRIWVDAEQDKGACFYFTVGTTPEPHAAED